MPITWDDEQPAQQGPLTPPPQPEQRTGLSRVLLGQPGGYARGGATVPAILARAMGASDPTAEAAGRFGQSMQRSLAMPWAPGTGMGPMAIRAAQSAGLGAAEGVSRGEGAKDIGKRAAIGGILSPVTDLAAQAVRPLFSSAAHKVQSGKTGAQLSEWLQQNVPAWAGMKGPRSLYEMGREGGGVKLSAEFEKALTAARESIPEGTKVSMLADVAKRVGYTGKQFTPKLAAGDLPLVEVEARELLTRLPSIKDLGARKQVLDALEQALPQGVIPEARRAYQVGSGWMDFAKKGGLFKKGETLDLSKAQEALRGVGKETLERRGMGEVRGMLRGPLSRPPIEKTTAANPAGVLGGLVGGLTGGQFGMGTGAGGAIGGGWLGSQLGKRIPIYKHVPEVLPAMGDLRRSLMQALAQQVMSRQRSTGE